jgi:hypothetical protein
MQKIVQVMDPATYMGRVPWENPSSSPVSGVGRDLQPLSSREFRGGYHVSIVSPAPEGVVLRSEACSNV